jgi:hypothetical protein
MLYSKTPLQIEEGLSYKKRCERATIERKMRQTTTYI